MNPPRESTLTRVYARTHERTYARKPTYTKSARAHARPHARDPHAHALKRSLSKEFDRNESAAERADEMRPRNAADFYLKREN